MEINDFENKKVSFNRIDKYPVNDSAVREKVIRILLILSIPVFIFILKVSIDSSNLESKYRNFISLESYDINNIKIYDRDKLLILESEDIDTIKNVHNILKTSIIKNNNRKVHINKFFIKINYLDNKSINLNIRIFQNDDKELYSSIYYDKSYYNKDIAIFLNDIVAK